MSEYSQFAITNNGLNMIAEAEQAKLLTFTRVVLGDGQLSDTDTIKALTALKQERLSVPIAKITKSAEHIGQTTITAHISNDSVETGFYVREIGVMAKVGDGDEKLFSYAYGGNYVDYMPDKNSPVNINKIDITLVTGNAENITAVVDKTVYMTHGEVEEAIEAHNSDSSAHPALSAALTEHNSSETAHKNLLQVTVTADKPASMSDRGLWVEIKSGLKAILHRWNKTTKTYDTLHPETETSQITDFDTAVNGKINTHNSSSTAHSALFGKKVNNDGDTMTGNLELKNALLQFTRIDDNTSNGKDYMFDPLNIIGSDGNRYGFMRIIKKAEGSRQLQIVSVDNQNNPSGSISINTDNNGTAISIQGVTPRDTANDTSITTAKWVNTKLNDYEKTSSLDKKLNDYEKTSSLANDIITKLAQTTAVSIVNALQTGSWFGQLLKLVLNASGVKYLINTNGYICFGSFFGGAIIQWMGVNITNQESIQITPPISFKNGCYGGVISDDGNNRLSYGFRPNNLTIYSEKRAYATTCHVIMIGN